MIETVLFTKHFACPGDYFNYMQTWPDCDQAHWISTHAVDIRYHLAPEHGSNGYFFRAYGTATPNDLVEYFLRYQYH